MKVDSVANRTNTKLYQNEPKNKTLSDIEALMSTDAFSICDRKNHPSLIKWLHSLVKLVWDSGLCFKFLFVIIVAVIVINFFIFYLLVLTQAILKLSI